MEAYFLHVTGSGISRRRFDEFNPEELPKLIGDQTGYGSVELVEGCLLDGYASVLCDDEFAKMPWPVTAVIDGYKYRGALVILRITRPFAFGPEKSEGIPVDRCDEIEKLLRPQPHDE